MPINPNNPSERAVGPVNSYKIAMVREGEKGELVNPVHTIRYIL